MRKPDKLVDVAAAVAAVRDGDTVYLGGTVLDRKPVRLVRELIAAGRKDLDLVTFAGSIDVDLLVAGGAVRSVAAAYVGLGPFGRAPRYTAAVEAGDVEDREYSEWTLLGRLRAASMGIPFLPTRGGTGSDVLGIHAFAAVRDPYGGDTYTALPPLHPDVALLHAWRAGETGDVQMAWPPQHLWDVDVVAARASRRVVVSVDEVVPDTEIVAEAQLTRLFSFEVDAVVESPGGSLPTSSPPAYEEDRRALAAYARSGGDDRALVKEGAT